MSAERWEVLEGDRTVMFTVPLWTKMEIEELPSYFAVVRPRG